jgi:adenylate cyclase
VTTDRDFEREGLLDDLEDERERAARLDLLRELVESGVDIEEIRRAVAEDRLATLPMELVFTRDCTHTLRAVMDELGLEEGFVRRNYLALGVPCPELDECALTDGQVEAWRMIKALLDAGVSEDMVLEFGRIGGRGAAQMADALIENFFGNFLKAGDTERDFGLRLADLATNLGPTLGPLMETPVRLHLRQRVRAHAVGKAERAAGQLPGTQDIAVSFADLVGFTRLSQHLSTRDLGQITARLETLAAEVADPPVRVVKLIGDAAMLVSPDTSSLVSAVRALGEMAEEDESFPRLRIGIAGGSALNRGGDWYGPPVNLASRICGVADPGAVLGSDVVVHHTRDRFAWTSIGTRELKGIDGAVELHRLGPATAGSP